MAEIRAGAAANSVDYVPHTDAVRGGREEKEKVGHEDYVTWSRRRAREGGGRSSCSGRGRFISQRTARRRVDGGLYYL
jgi:hypothetical protein